MAPLGVDYFYIHATTHVLPGSRQRSLPQRSLESLRRSVTSARPTVASLERKGQLSADAFQGVDHCSAAVRLVRAILRCLILAETLEAAEGLEAATAAVTGVGKTASFCVAV